MIAFVIEILLYFDIREIRHLLGSFVFSLVSLALMMLIRGKLLYI